MITCPNCRHINSEGLLYCEYCGIELNSDMSTHTDEVTESPDETRDGVTWGSAHIGGTTALKFIFDDTGMTIMLRPKSSLMIGRKDETTNTIPDIDLAPYGAIERGVSRQHSRLDVTEGTVMLTDIGSSNGTYLNGQRLLPNQPRILRDGDEIRFGKLVTHISFQ